jgi:glycosyltransferase involved in cell wall biosynthesis
MKKVVFFQPYIQKWRYDFLKRFISETKDQYEVKSFYGKYESKKQKAGTYKGIKDINEVGLISVPLQIQFNGQEYPIFWSPFLLFDLIKFKPDIVVTEGEINIFNNIQIDIYCKIFRKEFLWWSLGKVRTRKENIINKIFNPIIKYYLNSSKCILARNSLAKRYYINKYNIDNEKIIVVPNSLDDDAIRKEILENRTEIEQFRNKYKDSRVVLFSGALIKGKRLDDLLYAIKVLKDRYNNLVCIIVGDGPEKRYLMDLTVKYEIERNVIFTGAVYEGISKYFIAADLVVLPGMGGLVIHHAMIYKKPIITRIADGVEEDLVVDGYNGYVLKDYDNDELVNKIDSIIKNKDRAIDMGLNSFEIVKSKWNMDIMINQMCKAINS